jgi:glycosyltransferase involved in cell wall biosynthesis
MNSDIKANIKVSIIMPTYNRANYIIDTINSIRAQTYANWELLVMDDGSEDNTREIINAIKDERIHFYELGRVNINGRVKNIGINNATGEIIAFMDSDDLWPPEKLEKQLNALTQYPGAGYSLTNGYNFVQPLIAYEYYYEKRTGLEYSNFFQDYCMGKIAAFTQTLLLWKKNILISGLFDENVPFSDFDFLAKIAFNFKGILLYEPLLYRRIHATNHSSIDSFHMQQYYLTTLISYGKKKMLPYRIVKQTIFKAYVHLGEWCLLHGKWLKALKYFTISWRYNQLTITPLKKNIKAILYPFKKLR